MRFFRNAHIPFMKYRYFFFAFSGIMIAFSLYSYISIGLNFGIDFAGGTQMIINYQEPLTIATINQARRTLNRLNLGDVAVYEYGKAPDGNTYALVIKVEASSEEGIQSEQEEKYADVSVYVANQLLSENDRANLAQGKEDLNKIGRTQLEALLKQSGMAPTDIPDFTEEYLKPRLQTDEQLLNKSEMYYKMLAEAIIDYRENPEHGIFGSVDELKDINNDPELTKYNNDKPVSIITPETIKYFKDKYFLGSFSLIGVEVVGPSVGADLRAAAIASVISALIGILIYITIRFQFRFGIAAIISLIHDVLITVGIYAFSGLEFTLPIVASILTIVGYSLNDTIVVADRIRENQNKLRRESYSDLVDISINETLSRTILTSLTTLFVVFCLFFLGGSVLKGFAFAVMVGIIVGTYSSICVVSPILVIWQSYHEKYKKPERGTDYVKRSLKALFPDQAAKEKEEPQKVTPKIIQGETDPRIDHISRSKKKKGITGRKSKRKKKRH